MSVVSKKTDKWIGWKKNYGPKTDGIAVKSSGMTN